MSRLPDMHTHTRFSDGLGYLAENVERAAALGLPAIACTDHMPLRLPPPGLARPPGAPPGRQTSWHMAWDDLPAYIDEVRRLQRSHSNVEVLLGLEFDYWPGVEPHLRALREQCAWDYYLGSVHYLGDFNVDNEEEIPRWEESDVGAVWEGYFGVLGDAAESGFFDVIGHADLVKKFNFRPAGDCQNLYKTFLRRARAAGVAIELNTAGLRKPCGEIYPGLEMLALAREAGLPIVFGSDAHLPGDVGAGFAEASRLAREAGYREYLRFHRGGERELVPLP